MLPFLQPKKIATLMVSRRGKPGVAAKNEVVPGDGENPGLISAAEDLMSAIEQKSRVDIARALRAAFEICDAEPHNEGPHTNEDL